MDPTSSLLDSINQAASSRSPSTQGVLAHASAIIAPSEQVASQRTTSAPFELAAPESAMSAPAGNGATAEVIIEVGGDDSPLSSAYSEVIRLPRWDDLGRSYTWCISSSRTSASRERSPGPDHHHPHPPPGSRYRTCRALRSRTAHINPVERTTQLMGIGSTSPPHELRGGSRDDRAPSNLRLVKGPYPISSPI